MRPPTQAVTRGLWLLIGPLWGGLLWGGLLGACSSERVDCKAVCRRMFQQCPAEVLEVREHIDRDQLARLRAGSGLKAFGRKGLGVCLKSCSARSGRGSDAAAINRCMKRAGCAAFARCIAPHLR